MSSKSLLAYLLCFAYVLALVGTSCGTSATTKVVDSNFEGETKVIIEPDKDAKITEGIIFLKAIGIAKNTEIAREDAVKAAVKSLLFNGVSGSNVKRPLISDPNAAKKNEGFFKDFFKSGGPYIRFVEETYVDPKDRIKLKQGWQIGVRVKINYRMLEEELINKKIINKFGI